MKTIHLAIALTAASCLCPAIAATPAGIHNLNADWTFAKAKAPIPLSRAKASLEEGGTPLERFDFDDSGWEEVSLPHPVNAHDMFDDRAVDAGEGSFFRGMMFYRKRMSLSGTRGRKFFLAFETVRQTIYVWVNGTLAGYYEAGIAPTCYDISGLVKEGQNQILVATSNNAARGTKVVDNETRPGSEPGAGDGNGYQWNSTDFNEVQGGLVGNVELYVKDDPVYLTLPYYNNLKTTGQYVYYKDGKVGLEAEVRNEGDAPAEVSVRATVVDAATGKAAGTFVSGTVQVAPAKDKGVRHLTALESDVYAKDPRPTRVVSPEVVALSASAKIDGLTLWSPDAPHLYDVRIELLGPGGKVLDMATVRTGFRSVAYDAEKGGLMINGKNVWLRGYAQRSTDEWAAIGVAPDWLQDFDAKLIRSSNANFVRWMHVAPKPAPVRACDKYGIVNACPAGDKEGDVSGRTWAQRVEAMRDVTIYYRNSPSVLFWEGGNNALSPAHLAEMRKLKELLDPHGGRFSGSRTIREPGQIAEAEYAGTMLHRHEQPAFESMRKLGRFMPIMETEYARQESPRRCWDDYTPPHYDYVCKYLKGGKKESGFDVYDQTQEDFALSTVREYAEYYSSWSNGIGPRTYAACAALCWTDSNQHGRQSGTENCRSSGRVDAVRIPKMNYHVFRTIQSDEPAVKIVGHWSYPPLGPDTYNFKETAFNGKYMAETGKIGKRDPLHKTVYVIGSPHVASVELFVNGASKGVAAQPEHLFVWAFADVDVTESGKVEAVARDAAGKVIARDLIETAGPAAKLVLKAHVGPAGFRADGSDIAVVDLKLVDAAGRTLPYAADKVEFTLDFNPAESRSPAPVSRPPAFMGGYNSGVWGEASPIGKDWVRLECGENRVFVKAGRAAGRAVLTAKCNGVNGSFAESVSLEIVPVEGRDGFLSVPPQADRPNARTYVATTSAPVVQNALAGNRQSGPAWRVLVNGREVEFAAGAPFKPDDNTGVCCAYEPVLKALRESGADFEYVAERKRIPANKKYLRKLAPTPFVPMLTVKAGGREIDACAGFTELFLDNGRDKNLTNCEVYSVGRKNSAMVGGELSALAGYIPGVEITTDGQRRVVELKLRK